MTGGKDGTVALWNEDFSQAVHTYEVAPQKLAEGEPRLLSSSPSIRALTVANVRTMITALIASFAVSLEHNVERSPPWALYRRPSLPQRPKETF